MVMKRLEHYYDNIKVCDPIRPCTCLPRCTVQKLRYKRKKQGRLAGKLARRLEKLMSTQTGERDMFKSGDGRTDDTIQSLLHRHQEQRMDLLGSVQTLDLHEVSSPSNLP